MSKSPYLSKQTSCLRTKKIENPGNKHTLVAYTEADVGVALVGREEHEDVVGGADEELGHLGPLVAADDRRGREASVTHLQHVVVHLCAEPGGGGDRERERERERERDNTDDGRDQRPGCFGIMAKLPLCCDTILAQRLQ